MKPAFAFRLLEEYVGQDALDNAFQNYFEQWKFKHPGPEDTRISFEKSLGKDLGWLFDGYLNSYDEADYKLSGFDKRNDGYEIKVKNKSSFNPPLQIAMYKDDSIVHSQWFDGFSGKSEIFLTHMPVDKIVLDPFDRILDTNPFDNRMKTKGLLKKVLDFLWKLPNNTNIYRGWPGIKWRKQ